MSTITAASAPVAEGDRIKAINVPSVPHAEGRIATVTRYYTSGGAYNPDGLDFPYVAADFDEYIDEDGVTHTATNWCVWAWEKAEDDLSSITHADRALLVGKRVRALEVNGYERLEGQEITVTRVHDSTNASWTNGIAVYGIFDDNGQASPLWATKWEPVAPNLAADEVPTVPKADHDREVETLNARIRSLQEQVSQAHRAFEIASGILIREANDRGWCEAYDNIIDEINGDMPGSYRFEEREAEYDVEVEITATVTYTTTVSVTARSQEQAEEYLSDDMSSYVDAEEVLRDNHSYVNVTIDSVEVA